MIADAIKAAYPGATKVAVDISSIRFTDLKKGCRYMYLTPRPAQRALVDFDEGIKPAPFQFRIRNAHVARAGRKQKKPQLNTEAGEAGQEPTTSKKQKLNDKLERTLSKTALVVSTQGVRRVGGALPPQLHTRREFGVRAFRGGDRVAPEASAISDVASF